jgi:hypothetical protein
MPLHQHALQAWSSRLALVWSPVLRGSPWPTLQLWTKSFFHTGRPQVGHSDLEMPGPSSVPATQSLRGAHEGLQAGSLAATGRQAAAGSGRCGRSPAERVAARIAEAVGLLVEVVAARRGRRRLSGSAVAIDPGPGAAHHKEQRSSVSSSARSASMSIRAPLGHAARVQGAGIARPRPASPVSCGSARHAQSCRLAKQESQLVQSRPDVARGARERGWPGAPRCSGATARAICWPTRALSRRSTHAWPAAAAARCLGFEVAKQGRQRNGANKGRCGVSR